MSHTYEWVVQIWINCVTNADMNELCYGLCHSYEWHNPSTARLMQIWMNCVLQCGALQHRTATHNSFIRWHVSLIHVSDTIHNTIHLCTATPHCSTQFIHCTATPHCNTQFIHICIRHADMCSSCFTHMIESCHTYEGDTCQKSARDLVCYIESHVWMRHVTHINESFHAGLWVMTH